MSDSSHGMVIAITSVFTALPLFAVGLRAKARLIKTGFSVDDYLIFASMFFMILTISVPSFVLAANSHLGDHMVMSPDGHPMPPTYAFDLVLRILQTAHVVPITFAKLSILFFYRRIFRGAGFNAVSWAMIVVAAVWGIAFFFSTLFECTPIDLSLVQPPTSPMLKCIDQRANFWGLSASDFLIDIIILSIPFPFVWRLQMSTGAKLGVSAMFLLGILTIAASVARLIIFLNAGNLLAENDPDFTYYVAPTAYIVCIECSLAIVSACLPVLRPRFGTFSLDTLVRSMRNVFSLQSRTTGHDSPFKGSAEDCSESAGIKRYGSGNVDKTRVSSSGSSGSHHGSTADAADDIDGGEKQFRVQTTVGSQGRGAGRVGSRARAPPAGIVVERQLSQEARSRS